MRTAATEFVILMLTSAIVGAAEADGPNVPGRVSYEAGFFASYNPSNAEDMIRLVPGGAATLDATLSIQTQRGFGSAGTSVLINGRRFPGKSNEVATNLRRIAPASVERIELISGAAEGISTQSSGNLINVVLREGAESVAAGNYELNGRFNDQGRREADGLLAYSTSRNGWTYKASAQRDVWSPPEMGPNRWSDRHRDEVYSYPSGGVQELRPQDLTRDHDKRTYTAGVQFDARSGSRLELNGFYRTLSISEISDIDFTRYLPSGTAGTRGTERQQNRQQGPAVTEVSAEFQGALGRGNLDLLGIYHRENTPAQQLRDQVIGGALLEISRSLSSLRTGEDIVRATWTRGLGARRSLEVGGEVARNTLEQHLAVQFDLNSDGRVEPVAIPTALAQVRESRGEAFATLRLTTGGRTSFEGGLTYERSSITTNYSFYPERTLGYWKPRLDLRVRGWRSGQFRFLAQRTISQLDFNNFVPKFNIVDSRIDAGNPGLLPERTWAYELGYQERFAGDRGLVELRAYYNDIEGRIEKVPLRDAFGLYSASGNLPLAYSRGAELKASLRLDAVQLRNALLTVRYNWQQSSTVDPFGGARRRISSDRGNTYDVGLRQDWVRAGASAGFTYKNAGGVVTNSDLLVSSRLEIRPVLEVFAEKKLGASLVLRLEAQNVGGAREIQTRTLYAVNAIDGRAGRFDRFDEYRDTRIAVRLRGQF